MIKFLVGKAMVFGETYHFKATGPVHDPRCGSTCGVKTWDIRTTSFPTHSECILSLRLGLRGVGEGEGLMWDIVEWFVFVQNHEDITND